MRDEPICLGCGALARDTNLIILKSRDGLLILNSLRALMQSHFRKKMIRVFVALMAGIFFTLLLAEIGLRVAALVTTVEGLPSSAKDPGPTDQSEFVTIVTLGESTSAPQWNGERHVEWPRQLEASLNSYFESQSSRTRVKVFNLAKAASSSPFQVTALRAFKAAEPDVVISMMGINDAEVIPLERSFFYRRSYLVRYLYWARAAWNCPGCYQFQALGDAPELPSWLGKRDRHAYEDGLVLKADVLSRKDWEKVQKTIASLRERHVSKWLDAALAIKLFAASQHPALKSSDPALSAEILKESSKSIDRAFTEVSAHSSTLVEYRCHIENELGHSCLEILKSAFRSGLPLTPQLLTIASRQAGAEGDTEMAGFFNTAGFAMSNDSDTETTRSSYRELGDLAGELRVPWFAMQYPTGSVDQLKLFLRTGTRLGRFYSSKFFEKDSGLVTDTRYREVRFISNESFKDFVTPDNESEYFADFFARGSGLNFGHTTEKGHRVIAENVQKALIENWSEIEASMKARGRKWNHGLASDQKPE